MGDKYYFYFNHKYNDYLNDNFININKNGNVYVENKYMWNILDNLLLLNELLYNLYFNLINKFFNNNDNINKFLNKLYNFTSYKNIENKFTLNNYLEDYYYFKLD